MVKKIITIIVLLINPYLLSEINAQPKGWMSIGPNTEYGFHGVHFSNKNEGWAVGKTIIFTKDGGNTWYEQFEGLKEKYTIFFKSVFFIDRDHGWVVGDQGVILRTSNGGQTWIRLNADIEPLNVVGVRLPIDLFSVYFVNQETGWASGKFGTIMNTSNGGATWKKQRSATQQNLYKIFFIGDKNGWAVGSEGTILYTEDGGKGWFKGWLKGWKKQNSGINVPIWSIYFIDKEYGWAVAGRNIILHTTDGGKTWNKQKANVDKSLGDVFFLDKNNGWIVGYEVILNTTNGGNTWNVYPSGTRYGLVSLYFVDKNHGWAVGEHGSILRYVE
jgi:photosystem II stability/assembly factor-like uncharacterized protein